VTKPRVRALVALLLMLGAFAGALAWRPTTYLADSRPKVNLESIFPKQFGNWVVDDINAPVQLISPVQQAMLNSIYNQTLSRIYVNAKGNRIMLSVAYGGDQSDGTRAHVPEVCYPAQGFQILSNQPAEIALLEHPLRVRRLLAKLGGRIEPITYWLTVGDHTAISNLEVKFKQLSYSTRGVIPDGMLVRISSIDPEVARAYLTQQAFVLDLVRALASEIKPQIIGSIGA
jgi:EpsI family protein